MKHPPVPAKWIRNPSDRLAIEKGCWFDERAGLRVIHFIETFCKQSIGIWDGKALKLLAWQIDLIMRMFGWKMANGLRRFRRVYVEIAKKNGKSTLVAALSLYFLIGDGESTPKVYLNACDRLQATELLEESIRMVKASPELTKRLDILESKSRILYPKTNGIIRANSAEAPSKDGLNASLVVFEELHRQPGRSLWNVFKYAGASRSQPMTLSITTAGEDAGGVWHDQRTYSEKVNQGLIPDITHLGVVYRALEDDDIDSPETWKKANPSLGETLSIDDFRRELEEAKNDPGDFALFKQLRLNIIARAEFYLFTHEQWAACGTADSKVVFPDFAKLKKAKVYLGFDLSSTTDFTALVVLWKTSATHYGCWPYLYLPDENIEKLERRDGFNYRALAKEGLVTLTPGPAVDYDFMRREINALAKVLNIVKILGDPHMATQLIGQLTEQDGLPVEAVRQGFLSMNAPTKELQRIVILKYFQHYSHPILAWMASNVAIEVDAAGSWKPSKRKSRLKFDGIAGVINALAAAMGDTAVEKTSVYEKRGFFMI